MAPRVVLPHDALNPAAGARTFMPDAAAAGQRLDRYLARAAGLTRAQVQRLIAAGHARVDGRAAKAAQAVRPGQRIALSLPSPRPSTLAPQALPLAIVHEDDDLLVVDKPPGLVVHPAAGHREGTLVNALLHHRPRLREVGPAERPGIVHRLDRDTSGLLLVAKSPAAHAALSGQFERREVEKRYLALVHGVPRPEAGTIDATVGRHQSDRKRMGVRTRRGRAALTAYRVVEPLGDHALVELAPKTGRTHQLRVHLAHLGHPVLGDPVYGGRRERARRQGPGAGGRGSGRRREMHEPAASLGPSALGLRPPTPAVERQMLHAWRLAFRHPRTGERVELEAPPPPDFAAALAALRAAVRPPAERRGVPRETQE